MNIWFLSLSVFLFTYVLNLFYITVLYHRGLAHSSVILKPFMRKFTVVTGSWVTGIDPKAWACMHRRHHLHSDTANDPHSPWNDGVFGLVKAQLHAYTKTLIYLDRNRAEYTAVVSDLNFPISWVNRKRLWWLPYLLQASIAIALAVFAHAWILGIAYWAGMMSHPVQGWLVNSFAHKFGYKNFDNGDESRNNTLVAWLVMGEGYQNNHHARPFSARFSVRWFEVDLGYLLCKAARAMRLLDLPKTTH
jgi:stearoyl-CoA desaturase (delta-9 desaturase)